MNLLEKENRKLRRKLEKKEHEELVEMESLEREKKKTVSNVGQERKVQDGVQTVQYVWS